MLHLLSMLGLEVLKIVNNTAAVTVMNRREDETETHLQCLYTAILTTIYTYLGADICLLIRQLGWWFFANELTVYLCIFTKNVGTLNHTDRYRTASLIRLRSLLV